MELSKISPPVITGDTPSIVTELFKLYKMVPLSAFFDIFDFFDVTDKFYIVTF